MSTTEMERGRSNGHFHHISPTVLRLDESFACRVHGHRHTVQLPRRAQYVRMVDRVSPVLLLGTLVVIACILGAGVFGLIQIIQFVISNLRH